ncbi:MAG TPA: hypothetical protein VGC99_16820, partial [Candidatus Tectomicrobia bacterium]
MWTDINIAPIQECWLPCMVWRRQLPRPTSCLHALDGVVHVHTIVMTDRAQPAFIPGECYGTGG